MCALLLEYHVLELHEFVLVGGNRDDEAIFVLLELGLLVAHHNAEQLSLEALLLHRKVDYVRLRGHLRRVVRIAQLGCHVEAKVVVVLDLSVAELQVPRTTLLWEFQK